MQATSTSTGSRDESRNSSGTVGVHYKIGLSGIPSSVLAPNHL